MSAATVAGKIHERASSKGFPCSCFGTDRVRRFFVLIAVSVVPILRPFPDISNGVHESILGALIGWSLMDRFGEN